MNYYRGLRHRNLSAIRHATQRGLHQLQQLGVHTNNDDSIHQKNRGFPLLIQGLRTNPKGIFQFENFLFKYNYMYEFSC